MEGDGQAWAAGKDFAHNVLFCENDVLLVDALSRFVGEGLETGCAAVIIATESHRQDLDTRLRQRGLDPEGAGKANQYVAADAAETLQSFMKDGWPDEERFLETVTGLFARVGSQYQRVRAYGEMVALLCAEKKPEAALHIERLWNAYGRVRSFSLLCAYPWDSVKRDVSARQLHGIRDQHQMVIPQPRSALLTGSNDPSLAILDSRNPAAAQMPRG